MPVSTVPTLPHFFHAILSVLAERAEGLPRQEVYDAAASRAGLTPAQRAERLPGGAGKVARYRHRVGWAMSTLKAAGYVETPVRGLWRISERGRALLADHPGSFDAETMARIRREATWTRGGENAGDAPPDMDANGATETAPEERIEDAAREIRDATARDLLERLGSVSPAFFEELVLDVLRAMGYGSGEGDLEHVGRPGDGGIDGVIALDRLGFDKVYVQAKRWQGSVGRPEVQAFYGALAGRRARKGVLITTSSFTREARQYADTLSEALVLIDGPRLAALMIDAGVGVTTYRTIQLCRLDGDYFEQG